MTVAWLGAYLDARRRKGLALAFAAALLLPLQGCDRKPASKKPTFAGAVRIDGLTPATTTPLKVGEKVTIRADVSYRLQADAGTLGLVVQAENVGLAQSIQPVTKGSGKLTLSAEFVVPQSSAIQVYVPLQAAGQKATRSVDGRVYEVVGR